MLATVNEVYEQLIEENHEHRLSFSKFEELQPSHVRLQSKNQVNFLLLHTLVKRVHAASFKSVKTNQHKVVVQVDFAENYMTKTR